MNTYYFGRLKKKQPELPLTLFWPNQQDRGVHVNVSGAGVTAHAKHPAQAVKFLEWLASEKAQNLFAQAGTVLPPISATLAEAHIVVSKGPFAVRALFAQWRLNGGSDANNPSAGASASSSGSDIQNGWYVEPAYKITTWLGAFARYSEWNNRAGDANNSDTETRQIDYGVNFWPHPQVVLKADVMRQEGAIRDNGYNLGIGYMF